MDSTYVKAHQYSAGAKKRGIGGGNRKIGGFTSKIHAATDENGKVIDIFITVGNIHDSTQAEKLLHDTIHEGVYVIGDKTFDSERIVKYIEKNKGICVIPSRKNQKEQREYNKNIYKNRNQIERFFNRLKQFRRIATRYDKLLFSFLSLVQLAVVLITIPKFPSIV
ncbi:MAG: IS5 family transposase [Firmicutes bacterium]|nr:IS5 family transposase [Bacillota bacterium]